MKLTIDANRFSVTVIATIMMVGTFCGGNLVYGQQTLDIKAPGGNEAFGGEKMGTITIDPKEHTVNVVANITTPPKEGTVFEGWLSDVGGSDYKLSLGEFAKNGTLQSTTTLVNPYTYTQFIVTQEPFEDPDPNAAATLAGAELVSPFGQ
jgi:hypothetical protein